jgi:hypothetical protein
MKANENKGNEPFKITGNWSKQSNILQDKFAQLTDADLKFEAGKEEELIERVSSRLNKKREEVMNIIKKGQTEKV